MNTIIAAAIEGAKQGGIASAVSASMFLATMGYIKYGTKDDYATRREFESTICTMALISFIAPLAGAAVGGITSGSRALLINLANRREDKKMVLPLHNKDLTISQRNTRKFESS